MKQSGSIFRGSAFSYVASRWLALMSGRRKLLFLLNTTSLWQLKLGKTILKLSLINIPKSECRLYIFITEKEKRKKKKERKKERRSNLASLMFSTSKEPIKNMSHHWSYVARNIIKSSRCPKLDGYAIANFGVRVEREWFSGVASGVLGMEIHKNDPLWLGGFT